MVPPVRTPSLAGFNGTNQYAMMQHSPKKPAISIRSDTGSRFFTGKPPGDHETNLAATAAIPEAVLEEVTRRKRNADGDGAKISYEDETITRTRKSRVLGNGEHRPEHLYRLQRLRGGLYRQGNNVSVWVNTGAAHMKCNGCVSTAFTFNDAKARNVDVVFQPMLCQHCDNAPARTFAR